MAENVESNIENMLKWAWNGVWWDVLLRGAIAIIFGLLVFFMPGLTVAFFVLLFGAFAIADGILLLLQAVTVKDGRWWARLLQGLVAIAAGVVVFLWPKISALTLLYIIALYLIMTGVLQAIAAIEMRKVIKNEWLYVISGILAVIVGVLLVIRPLTGAIALAQTIGIFAIAYGIFICALALELRGLPQKVAKPT
ncbi:MAG TPA: HdeD family acid-resistance protein [Methanocella sp.]|uniref:HdeD family acid-resistance protein n=1 Tax=Methanocella sp. TaxID=2052833 RepID=UPI002BB3F79F|nr:HdeD family acid-resistance protein [Methanocella sp.]HTY90132.1 HdeD family acid-resistance protein [Methanocella sp.]